MDQLQVAPQQPQTVPNLETFDEHRRHADQIRDKIRDALTTLGHKCDDDLKLVDRVPLMLFVLPSKDYVYVGYGPTGGREAYRGPEDRLDYNVVAQSISQYLKTAPPLPNLP